MNESEEIKCLNCGNIVTPVELEKEYTTICPDCTRYIPKEYCCPVCGKAGRELEIITVKEK